MRSCLPLDSSRPAKRELHSLRASVLILNEKSIMSGGFSGGGGGGGGGGFAAIIVVLRR